MSNFPSPETIEAYEAFWQGRNQGPVIHYRYPVEVDDAPDPPGWMGRAMHPDWGGAAKAFDAALAAEAFYLLIEGGDRATAQALPGL